MRLKQKSKKKLHFGEEGGYKFKTKMQNVLIYFPGFFPQNFYGLVIPVEGKSICPLQKTLKTSPRNAVDFNLTNCLLDSGFVPIFLIKKSPQSLRCNATIRAMKSLLGKIRTLKTFGGRRPLMRIELQNFIGQFDCVVRRAGAKCFQRNRRNRNTKWVVNNSIRRPCLSGRCSNPPEMFNLTDP